MPEMIPTSSEFESQARAFRETDSEPLSQSVSLVDSIIEEHNFFNGPSWPADYDPAEYTERRPSMSLEERQAAATQSLGLYSINQEEDQP